MGRLLAYGGQAVSNFVGDFVGAAACAALGFAR